MSQVKDYQVNYTINVEAGPATEQVKAFAESLQGFSHVKGLDKAAKNIKSMMKEMDKIFRPKGRKRDYSFKFNIDTSDTEAKLGRVKEVLTEIQALTTGIKLVINAGEPLKTNTVKAEAKKLMDIQKPLTQAAGKVVSALVHLEKERQIRVKSEDAEQKLKGVLSLLRQIHTASLMINLGNVGRVVTSSANVVPYAAGHPFLGKVSKEEFADLSKAKRAAMYAQLYSHQKKYAQRYDFERGKEELRVRSKERKFALKEKEREKKRLLKEEKEKQNALSKQQEERKRGIQKVLNQQYEERLARQRGAINRLQYTKMPTLRSLPMGYMFNAYMGYNLMRTELSKAVDYANIMESARSILKVADRDMGTFESRFDAMARYVRRIGTETKFTAIEIGGAVKYLSMAGMDMATINKSIRPITNLALIGDNDVGEIADLATNIMAGYHIHQDSMHSVADILASTVSRSNVNIIEMAESFKMAAGYLKLSGINFSEAAAAIGVLGNAGLKATISGTSLRAMSTRFAKPPKEAREALDRLGVRFTHFIDMYGSKVERVRPLADIFKDLKNKGASVEDMATIFGKIAGNSATVFLQNYEQIRKLTAENRLSHGLSGELAKVKQETTKGLWYQLTSQFSESFMQGYEILEPQIKRILRDLITRFNVPEFGKGLAAVGRVLLDILATLAKIGTWFAKNFHWLEPVIFSGFVATRLFKLAGAITNVGVALGVLGRQSAVSAGMQMLAGITQLTGGGGTTGKLSFAQKRVLVMARQLMPGQKLPVQLFAQQVANGSGLVGAAASIASLGGAAVGAMAAGTALIGVLSWVAYKAWKVKEAKDALTDEVNGERKYRYPSIEALREELKQTYKVATETNEAVDNLTAKKTIKEELGFDPGGISWKKIAGFLNEWMSAVRPEIHGAQPFYSRKQAYQEEMDDGVMLLANKYGQRVLSAGWAELGNRDKPEEIQAFMNQVRENYGTDESKVDSTLSYRRDGKTFYKKGLPNDSVATLWRVPEFVGFMNDSIAAPLYTGAQMYRDAMSSTAGALAYLSTLEGEFMSILSENDFIMQRDSTWAQKPLPKNATSEQVTKQREKWGNVKKVLLRLLRVSREKMGGNAVISENIVQKAGFNSEQYSNEPQSKDGNPSDAPRITNGGPDDGKAGGNYSGTGKLSSTTPKQVIVTISNLLSIQTIELLNTPEGRQGAIVDLKEQMAQALIDVVHDFDASWNG